MCKYCDVDGYEDEFERTSSYATNITIYIDHFLDGSVKLAAHDIEYGSTNYFKINYCTMCGKEL